VVGQADEVTPAEVNAGNYCRSTFNGVFELNNLNKNNYTNTAQLKEIMTAPPMTAEQHAIIIRKRIKDRRMIEEARERKTDEDDLFGSQA
jgi:hypothetical protein